MTSGFSGGGAQGACAPPPHFEIAKRVFKRDPPKTFAPAALAVAAAPPPPPSTNPGSAPTEYLSYGVVEILVRFPLYIVQIREQVMWQGLTSSESFLLKGAEARRIFSAVAGLPVKDINRISGCLTMASPTRGPVPNTMLTTPAGRPKRYELQRILL